jgi:hypothetical protein
MDESLNEPRACLDVALVHALENAVADALCAMTATADSLEEDGDLQGAHYLRHRIDALDKAADEFVYARIQAMSPAQLREEMARDGLDFDACGDRGVALVRRLCDEHRKRSEVRDALASRWACGDVTGDERSVLFADVAEFLDARERAHDSFEPWEPIGVVELAESFGIPLDDAGRLFDAVRDGN